MTVPTVACTHCGKNFTTDDLRRTSCKYCGTVLAHHARAHEQVAVLNQMMVDRNGNGIPDAYEGLVANAQANALNQAFGLGPYSPPMNGGAPMHPMSPLGAPVVQVHMANAHAAHAVTKSVIKFTVIAIAAVTLFFVVIGALVAGAFLWTR